MLKLPFAVSIGVLGYATGVVAAPCSSYPFTLTNGQPADATQVMADFNCAALTSGSTINNLTLTGSVTLPSAGLLTNSGHLIINGSVPLGTNAGVTVYQNSSEDGFTAAASGSGAGGTAFVAYLNGVTQNIGYWLLGGANVGSITSNGSSTAYNTTSDARLKTVLPTQINYRDTIRKLWVGDFEWKKTHAHSFGVVAQQAYPLFPDAITPPRSSREYWQADYGKFAPLALWGIQDIYRTIDRQDTEIATLKTEIAALRVQLKVVQN